MEAKNRKIEDWCGRIKRAEIKLPRFQRFEAWDRNRISGLLSAIIQEPSLPLGITLIMEVGDDAPFVSRYLETAEPAAGGADGHIREYLLDGQQRLTALWRLLHNNYDKENYYVYIKAFDPNAEEEWVDGVYWQGLYYNEKGNRRPLWCDSPMKTLERGYIPTELLDPLKTGNEVDDWIDEAIGDEPESPDDARAYYRRKNEIQRKIGELRLMVGHYNLPYLALPSSTDKVVALNVFINMNTNNKPLSVYDIAVAQLEAKQGKSLHELQENLCTKYPAVERYGSLSRLILNTSCLLQGRVPNQQGAGGLDMDSMLKNWDALQSGVNRMATFLQDEGICDERRLPTNAVPAVLSALYRDIPESGDELGEHERLLKKYLWYAFFTGRYEGAAATRAHADFNALRKMIRKEKNSIEDGVVPIFGRHSSLPSAEGLMEAEWPKGTTIMGRGILAVAGKCGALDFATGKALTGEDIGERHYHHIFPQALLEDAGIKDGSYALNCALIADKTNYLIGAKEPAKYLKDRAKMSSEDIVRERLHSHLIPYDELLSAGGYEKMSAAKKSEKIKADFNAFLSARAELIVCAIKMLTNNHSVSAAEVFRNCKSAE